MSNGWLTSALGVLPKRVVAYAFLLACLVLLVLATMTGCVYYTGGSQFRVPGPPIWSGHADGR